MIEPVPRPVLSSGGDVAPASVAEGDGTTFVLVSVTVKVEPASSMPVDSITGGGTTGGGVGDDGGGVVDTEVLMGGGVVSGTGVFGKGVDGAGVLSAGGGDVDLEVFVSSVTGTDGVGGGVTAPPPPAGGGGVFDCLGSMAACAECARRRARRHDTRRERVAFISG